MVFLKDNVAKIVLIADGVKDGNVRIAVLVRDKAFVENVGHLVSTYVDIPLAHDPI